MILQIVAGFLIILPGTLMTYLIDRRMDIVERIGLAFGLTVLTVVVLGLIMTLLSAVFSYPLISFGPVVVTMLLVSGTLLLMLRH